MEQFLRGALAIRLLQHGQLRASKWMRSRRNGHIGGATVRAMAKAGHPAGTTTARAFLFHHQGHDAGRQDERRWARRWRIGKFGRWLTDPYVTEGIPLDNRRAHRTHKG